MSTSLSRQRRRPRLCAHTRSSAKTFSPLHLQRQIMTPCDRRQSPTNTEKGSSNRLDACQAIQRQSTSHTRISIISEYGNLFNTPRIDSQPIQSLQPQLPQGFHVRPRNDHQKGSHDDNAMMSTPKLHEFKEECRRSTLISSAFDQD